MKIKKLKKKKYYKVDIIGDSEEWKDEDGAVGGMYTTLTESELTKDGYRLDHYAETILQTSMDGFCVISLEGRLLEVN